MKTGVKTMKASYSEVVTFANAVSAARQEYESGVYEITKRAENEATSALKSTFAFVFVARPEDRAGALLDLSQELVLMAKTMAKEERDLLEGCGDRIEDALRQYPEA